MLREEILCAAILLLLFFYYLIDKVKDKFAALDDRDRDFMKQVLWDFSAGLKNRNCCSRDLAKYREQGFGGKSSYRSGFVVTDMNYLKTVNDACDHAEGDRLTAAAASVLWDHLKTAKNVYRLGGDELAAICLSPDDRTAAEKMDRVNPGLRRGHGICGPDQHCYGVYASGDASGTVSAVFRGLTRRGLLEMYAHKMKIKRENPQLFSG